MSTPHVDVLNRPYGYVVPAHERLPIVTEWSGPEDFHNAPPTYEDFYRQYAKRVPHLLFKFAGSFGNDLEDAAAEILARFIERDSIGVFCREWETRSKTGKSVFCTYFYHFVKAYAPGKKRNYRRYREQNHLLCDAKIGHEANSLAWIDMNCPTTEFETDLLEQAEFKALISRVFDEIDVSIYDAAFTYLEMAMSKGRPVGVVPLARKLDITPHYAEKVIAQVKRALRQAVAGAANSEFASNRFDALMVA